MKQIFTIIIILSLCSCQLLKKDKQILKKLSQQEQFEVTGQRNTLLKQSQLVLIDSNHHDYTMMLWPKGKFTYSLAEGFKGEAEQILLKGKQANQKQLSLVQGIKQDSLVVGARYISDKESISVVKKRKLNLGYNWTWLLLIPICYILYQVYSRIRKLIG
jgi:hypothetical protein